MAEARDRSLIDAIKAALNDPREVVQRLGLDRGMQANGPNDLHILCPWHSEDTPSCHVWLARGQLAVKCFGACDRTGDVLDLIAAAERVERKGPGFRRVLERGAELARLPPPERSERGTTERRYPPRAEVDALWRASLPVDRCPEATAWLESRGLDAPTVARLNLARSIPVGANLPGWAFYNGRPWLVTGHRLLLPMYDAGGVMRSVRARAITSGEKAKAVPPRNCRMGELVMASPEAVAMFRGEGDPVGRLVVAEGEPDFLTACQRWGGAVVGVGSGAWVGAHAERVPRGATVVLWTDIDVPGDGYARSITATLPDRKILRRPSDDPRDLNDLHMAGGLPDDPAAGAADQARDWRDSLLYKESARAERTIVNCTANAISILRNDPDWSGVLAWDDFAQGIIALKPVRWDRDDAPNDRSPAWRETDAVRLQAWLARRYSLHLSPRECYAAALVVAESARFDPVADWLRSLAWDGTPRIDRWLTAYLGAVDAPYARFVGRAFLVSAVARAFKPGCKVDTMMVLEGDQGIRKSTALRALFGAEWFSDTPLEMGSKDRFVGLRSVWCHEMAELDSFGKTDANRVKSFLSSQTDDFRPPYAQTTIKVPRRTVFAGTVNPTALGYLRDETGNRRIWPVRCGLTGGIDLAGLERDRALIWAEARELYEGGVRWWPETPAERALCSSEQEERVHVDVWLGRVQTFLAGQTPGARVTIPHILSACLNIEPGKQDRAAATRVGVCLSLAGWVQAGRQGSGARDRLYGRRDEVDAQRLAEPSAEA